MKKMTIKRTLHSFLSLFLLVVLLLPNGLAQAEGADPGIAGLERIGETADTSKPVADKVVLAVIGDYGDCFHNCEHEQAVADLVHSWNPEAILTVGDNSYRLGTVEEVEADQEPYWADIAAGRFFPIYGNHDYGNGCSLESIQPSLDYFKIPVSYVTGFGNGLVDFVNPDANCNMSSDNGTPPKIFDSYKKTVEESQAKWVMTGGHQPIFSSGQAGNNLNRRWLMTPGVDLLLQGHDHHAEHIETPEGYNEVITGNGGQSLTPLFPPIPGSLFRDNSEYGAVRLTITPETMTVDYINVPGTLVYSFTLKKDPFTKKAYIASRTDWTDPNPLPGGGQQGGNKTVSMAFGEDDEYKNGLDWFPYESGPAHEIELDGRTVLQIDRSAFGTGNNLYMQINDERIYGGPYKATANIEYRSPAAGSFVLQYESAATGSTYQSAQRVNIAADQVDKWQTVTLDMPAARFTNRQNGGADLRIVAANKLPLIISSMRIDAVPEELPVTLWAIRIQDMGPLKPGETGETRVNGIYSDFSNAPLTSGLTFASSDSAVASVDESNGLITAHSPGDTVITAAYGELQDQYHVVVEESPSGITLQGPTELKAGETGIAVTKAVYGDNSVVLTEGVIYDSSDKSVATIDTEGTIHALAEGTTVLSAVYGEMSDEYTLTVQPADSEATLAGLEIGGLDRTMKPGQSGQAEVTAAYSDGSSRTITEGIAFSSSDPAIAAVDQNGMVQARKEGTSVITAAYGGVSATFELTVKHGNSNGHGTGPSNPTSPSNPSDSESGRLEVTAEQLTGPRQGGEVTIRVNESLSELVLPGKAAELLADAALSVKADNIALAIPAKALEQFSGQVPDGELADSTITLRTTAVPSTEADALLAGAGQRAGANLKAAGGMLDIGLSFTMKDRKNIAAGELQRPIAVSLPAEADVDINLSGIYRIADDGKLEYVGGSWNDGIMTASVRQFGKYALLEYDKTFTDLKADHWAADAVKRLAARQLIEGVSVDRFSPERSVTRAEFTVMLVRLLGIEGTEPADFSDVPAGAWYSADVAAAVRAGIVNGAGESRFEPNKQVSRQEMAAMLVRAYEFAADREPAAGESPFTDISSAPEWAQTAIGSAYQLGLINGRSDARFQPNGTGTCAESAKMIDNLMKIMK